MPGASLAVTLELKALIEILAEWVDPPPGVLEVFLFGSRVRSDHKPDSDVDVRVYPEEWQHDPHQVTENASKFADLQKRLPGRLDLGRYKMNFSNVVDRTIKEARAHPYFAHGKVVCLWTPPKPPLLPSEVSAA